MSPATRLGTSYLSILAMAAGLVLAFVGQASAQDSEEIRVLKERVDRQDAQIQAMVDELAKRGKLPPPAPDLSQLPQAIRDELKVAESEGAANRDKRAGTFEVGDDRSVAASWQNDGLHFQSENSDFDIHLGGRINTDFVWWKQPAYLKGTPPGVAGIPGSTKGAGEGVYDDGAYFRRIRTRADGTLYENFEFQFETAFENLSRVTFQEAWIGVKDVPFLGNVRIGHQRVPQGLDSYSSNRYLEMMEESALGDTFEQEFASGLLVGNSFLDGRATYAAMLHRVEVFQQYNGASFGDGNGAFTGRLSALPLFDESGRAYLHTAASYQYRTGNLGRTWGDSGMSSFGMSQNVVRFRDRPELRDAAGAGADIQGDSARLIDTGYLATSGVTTVGTELLAVDGPFYLQAESTVAEVEHGRRVDTPANYRVDHGSPIFWGYYAQVGYFFTGEYRPYINRNGTYGRVVPNSNFFLVRNRDGTGGSSLGAVEAVYRFSFDDLNSHGINGGTVAEHTVGLNWYWSPNIRMQFNYTNANRNSLGSNANTGTVQGLGVRSIIDF